MHGVADWAFWSCRNLPAALPLTCAAGLLALQGMLGLAVSKDGEGEEATDVGNTCARVAGWVRGGMGALCMHGWAGRACVCRAASLWQRAEGSSKQLGNLLNTTQFREVAQ